MIKKIYCTQIILVFTFYRQLKIQFVLRRLHPQRGINDLKNSMVIDLISSMNIIIFGMTELIT